MDLYPPSPIRENPPESQVNIKQYVARTLSNNTQKLSVQIIPIQKANLVFCKPITKISPTKAQPKSPQFPTHIHQTAAPSSAEPQKTIPPPSSNTQVPNPWSDIPPPAITPFPRTSSEANDGKYAHTHMHAPIIGRSVAAMPLKDLPDWLPGSHTAGRMLVAAYLFDSFCAASGGGCGEIFSALLVVLRLYLA